jgi:hypothetical protein
LDAFAADSGEAVMSDRTWCNRNPVGTRCEVHVGTVWLRGTIGGYSPDHLRVSTLEGSFELRRDEERRFRVFDYQAGLRRAQELAKELSFEAYGEALHILAPELYEAIDAEVAKEEP